MKNIEMVFDREESGLVTFVLSAQFRTHIYIFQQCKENFHQSGKASCVSMMFIQLSSLAIAGWDKDLFFFRSQQLSSQSLY